MKLLHHTHVVCDVNGVEMPVPYGAKYLTIDCFGNVKVWFEKPYMANGVWLHDDIHGIAIATVEMEHDDVWLTVFDVSQNRFVELYQY